MCSLQYLLFFPTAVTLLFSSPSVWLRECLQSHSGSYSSQLILLSVTDGLHALYLCPVQSLEFSVAPEFKGLGGSSIFSGIQAGAHKSMGSSMGLQEGCFLPGEHLW